MLLSSLTELPFFEQFKIDKEKLITEIGIFIVKKEEENKETMENYQSTGLSKNANQLIMNKDQGDEEKDGKRSSKCKC
jgi:hypothetical protein